ncbi:LCP family protein [Kribbella sp. VKM Ac-2568]|uniref:LCP family protein n=1 Tax=Kribbella sp. VKM Ac-2568 TaxID=2512219 RepID=UPI001048D80A|nr:LCP family protein [Kribbella sp. VKM Ac-2568]TCM37874.1 LytR family transcriptional attenuator [Kribbella sp. VKM Ac-2568]
MASDHEPENSRGPARRAVPRQRAKDRGTFAILGLTLVGSLIPGTGYLFAGRRKLGAAVLGVSVALLAVVAYLVLTRREQIIELAVTPQKLLYATLGLLVLGVAWIVVIITSHRALRPGTASEATRVIGAAFVGVLCFAVAVPTAMGVQTARTQRDLVKSVFAGKDSESATRPTVKNKKNPWAAKPRLNILLLGADDGPDRDGVRTDTVIVASIDTTTGDTSLISLPRKLMFMPFPKGTKLHEAYPDGFGKDGISLQARLEWMLDAIYKNVPAAHPGIVGRSDNEGADVLKLAVGEATGLTMDYYVQINLAGFTGLVNALGGITVNINYPIPVGGSDDAKRPPNYYLKPAQNKHLWGLEALWYARGRYQIPNPDDARSARQRCAIHAIAEAATPANLLKSYQKLAAVGKNMVRTDIPQDLLPAFLDLGLKVKSAKVSEVPLDGRELKFAYPHPDYEGLRATVAAALAPKPATPTTPVKPRTTATPVTPRPGTSTTPGTTTPTADLADACEYHPVETP